MPSEQEHRRLIYRGVIRTTIRGSAGITNSCYAVADNRVSDSLRWLHFQPQRVQTFLLNRHRLCRQLLDIIMHGEEAP